MASLLENEPLLVLKRPYGFVGFLFGRAIYVCFSF
jgi:hypothetical protein